MLNTCMLDNNTHKKSQTILATVHHICIVSVYHLVEPPYLRLEPDDAPASVRGSGLSRPAKILLFSWRGDRHCCVDLVGVSPARSNWQQAAEALRLVQEAKCAKHAETCLAHGFDFAPFSFSVLGSFGPTAQEVLTRVCQRYVSHARIRPWEAHQWVYRRLSFAVMRGVAEQFVRRQSSDFGW